MEWGRKHWGEATAFTVVMALVIVIGIFHRRQSIASTEFLRPNSASERTARWYEAARAPLPIGPTVSSGCREVWNRLRGLDLAELVEYPPRPKLIPLAGSCSPPTPTLERVQNDYQKSCNAIARWNSGRSQKEWRSQTRPCTSALISYRAAITDFLTRGRKPASIDDPRVLTDKLIAQLGEEKGGGIAFAERLLQLDPEMYPAAKAVLAVLLDDAATRPTGRVDDPIWEQIDIALRRAEGLAGAERRQLIETELAVVWMRYRDPARAKEKAQAMTFSHPELGVGPYYEAWAAYQAGNRTKARNDLAEAINREPKQRHFRESWEKLQQEQAGQGASEPPFRTYLSFGFDVN